MQLQLVVAMYIIWVTPIRVVRARARARACQVVGRRDRSTHGTPRLLRAE